MNHEPRQALTRFTATLEEHLAAVMEARGEEDFTVGALYERLAEALEDYAEALDEHYGEALPFENLDEE